MRNNFTLSTSMLVLLISFGTPWQSQAQHLSERQGEAAAEKDSTRSEPPDLTSYVRPAIAADHAPRGKAALPPAGVTGSAIFPNVYLADAVINNTDPNLVNTDTFGDSEPSIALNPRSCVAFLGRDRGCREIVLLSFSGGWNGQGSFAPLWLSTNWGQTWTKEFTIPIPPNAPGAAGCPCDQTPDFGGGQLSATFLTGGNDVNVYSGGTSNPADSSQWQWLTNGGTAQRTNHQGVNDTDQPWLLMNRDPDMPAQNDVYVGYDNFAGDPDMRVAASYGAIPLDFTTDSLAGFSTGGINPGQRLAVDPRNGAVYSLFQQCVGTCNINDNPKTINYVLNRSLDGGMTWSLNGSSSGTIIAMGQSTQPRPKFGTVNALLGGVDHVTVDANSGDVYVVYGDRDANTGNNRLSIVRLTDDGHGGLTVGSSFFVTGQVQAALPSVAVAGDSRGSVGVLYDTYDGMDPSGFPTFSAHLAVSSDHGMTFQDVTLETFLSPSTDNNNQRQRVLGDYHQLKSVGTGFYGVFTGNGVPFGRTVSNTDPIFFKTFLSR